MIRLCASWGILRSSNLCSRNSLLLRPNPFLLTSSRRFPLNSELAESAVVSKAPRPVGAQAMLPIYFLAAFCWASS
jgi:hypothetical protein